MEDLYERYDYFFVAIVFLGNFLSQKNGSKYKSFSEKFYWFHKHIFTAIKVLIF